MLTTRRISRVRLAGGTATVALLGAAALGLTASGTQAAAHVRSKVQTVTGIDLAALDRMPTMPTMPIMDVLPAASSDGPIVPPASSDVRIVPPASSDVSIDPIDLVDPVAPIAPVAPVAPLPAGDALATAEHIDATDGRVTRHHVVRIGKDGDIVTDDIAANVPRVTSVRCGGADRPMVIKEEHGGKRSITICTDRIERAAAHGEAMAANSVAMQRTAYRSAVDGLRRARATVSASSMTADARREALQAIDGSLAEMQADIAGAD